MSALAASILLAVHPARAQPPDSGKGPVSSTESAELRDQARKAIEKGDFAAALKLVDRTRSIVTPTERTAWWLIEAELEYAQKRFTKSALAAMKIVVLHPKSQQTGAGLYWAARSYEAIGRPAKSVALYEECLANRKTPSGLRDAAKSRLAELKKKTS